MEFKAKEMILPRYMTHFECLGQKCEDSCCSNDWTIVLDKKHYKKIEKSLLRAQKSKTEFTKKVQRLRGPDASNICYAKFVLDKNNRCSFLSEQNLCALQQQFGVDILPSVCVTYPRLNQLINNRFERFASLSCPEIARKCLLDPEALVLENSNTPPHPNSYGNIVILPENDNLYHKYIDDVRTTILNLLNLPSYSLETKLFFVLFFAIRSEEYFHDQISNNPKAALSKDIDYINEEKNQKEIQSLTTNIACNFTQPTEVVIKFLNYITSIKNPITSEYKFANRTLHAINNAIGENESKDEFLIDTYQHYLSLKTKLPSFYQNKLENYLHNFVANYWLSYPYTFSTNLVVHTRKLLFRLASIKLCLFYHPDILKLTDTGHQQDEEEFNRILIETVYILSRTYEHSQRSMNKVEEEIYHNEEGLPLLAAMLKY